MPCSLSLDALASNPHAYPPTRSEIATLYLPNTKPTFPSPLPAHLLPRTRPAPSPPPPTSDPHSGEAGRYSMSLTGVRRQLRSKGARAEALVKLVEAELDGWVAEVGRSVVVLPARQSHTRRVVDPFLVGEPETEAIVEVQRGSASLCWEVGASFERFVVHCVARHHNLVCPLPCRTTAVLSPRIVLTPLPVRLWQVSFSKPTADGKRQTHILLPPSRSSHHRSGRLASAGTLDTPPTTDLSSVNGSGTDTDAGPSGPASTAYGGHWGSWDSESEAEPDGPATRLAPLIRDLAIHSGALPPAAAPAPASAGAVESDTNALSYEDDETSDDESVSSAALSSLADSLAQLPVNDRRLLPHRPERHVSPAPAFVPTPNSAGDTDSEAEDADRTFTPASFATGPPVPSVQDKSATSASGKQSFWEFVYA
jgi:hypothetical protein